MNIKWVHSLLVVIVCSASTHVMAEAEAVISDQGVSLSGEELEYIVSQWPPRLQQTAANDIADRAELLNKALASKKIASQAMQLTPQADGDAYWRKELLVRKTLQQFMVSEFMQSIDVPDMSGLAMERYLAAKDKYAWVAPSRLSSHILLRCGDTSCDPKELKEHAERLLLELRAGGDFEAMVLKYSEDPGSRLKKGRFDQWLDAGSNNVDRKYLEGVFSITEVGAYSDVVVSSFGYHIIRLDELREGYYQPFEAVKGKIITDLGNEYGKLAVKNFDEAFRFTDDLYIDGDAMEMIFDKYKSTE